VLIEARQLGILLLILGLIMVGFSFRYFESTDEEIRRRGITRFFRRPYRVRIVRGMFWTGLILMALGAALQW
jgi:hypothetical protein